MAIVSCMEKQLSCAFQSDKILIKLWNTVNIPDGYNQHETIPAIWGFVGCSNVEIKDCLIQKTILFNIPALRKWYPSWITDVVQPCEKCLRTRLQIL